jgi:flagellar hook protein FlgE
MLTATGSFAPDEQGYLRTQSGLYLLGWPADVNGVVSGQPRDSVAGLRPVQVNLNQYAASPTTEIRLGLNLPAADTVAGAAGTPYDLPIEYFDTLGRSQSLTLTFTPSVPATGASNAWNVSIVDNAGNPLTPIGSFGVTFDTTAQAGGSVASITPAGGASYNAATGAITVTTASGPIDIVVGAPGGYSPLTQLSATFAPLAISKDGAPIGNLSSVEINQEGFLEAVYDTGFRRTIYQIPVGDVPNYRGLTAEGNQAFSVSQESGDVYFWDAGDGPAGLTIGFALAESTTDVAGELTDLIQTQRAYSSNAKIIQTIDEILQETTDIIR